MKVRCICRLKASKAIYVPAYHFFLDVFVIIAVCHMPCAMLIETIWKTVT